MLMYLHFVQFDNVLYDNVIGLALYPVASITAVAMRIMNSGES